MLPGRRQACGDGGRARFRTHVGGHRPDGLAQLNGELLQRLLAPATAVTWPPSATSRWVTARPMPEPAPLTTIVCSGLIRSP